MWQFFVFFTLTFLSLFGVKDPLPSWNQGKTKERIIKFVEEVTSTGKNFVPVENRIATFDNDGTLWVEKPNVQWLFTLKRIQALVHANPTLREKQPYKAILDKNYHHISKEEAHKIFSLVYGGITEQEFNKEVEEFFAQSKDERFRVPHTEAIYKPMLELMNFLREKNFKVYICTGGGLDFLRLFSEKTYGVSKDQIIGTSTQKKFKMDGLNPFFMRTGEIVLPINIQEGKAINIQRYIGKKPILAAGNSNGDIEMLEYTADPKGGPYLSMLVHHDDRKREYLYDKGAEKALKLAKKRDFVIISMKKDFKKIFSFEK